MKVHKTEIRVRFGDTDPFGVVYYVSYFRYIKDALDEYIRSSGFEPEKFYRDVKRKIGFPIVEAFCRYKAPARYDDLLEIHTSIKEIKEKSIKFNFDVYKKEEKKFLANGYLTILAIDENWRPIKIPDDIRNLLTK